MQTSVRYDFDVDPKPLSDRYSLISPLPDSSEALQPPGDRFQQQDAWPRVDDHLVTPETREEMVRGRKVVALPANPPHGERHCELNYVIRGLVAEGYVSATCLLTRLGPRSNFATDTCIRREGKDPRTGTRWLEELAFVVVSEQSIRDITERAEDLTARGVRRLVAIFVEKNEVREWSPERAEWTVLDLDATFTDPTLRHPIKVRALLDTTEAENAVARALVAKNNPVIAEIRDEGRREVLDSFRESIEQACATLDIPTDDQQRAQLRELDGPALESLHEHLLTERRWP